MVESRAEVKRSQTTGHTQGNLSFWQKTKKKLRFTSHSNANAMRLVTGISVVQKNEKNCKTQLQPRKNQRNELYVKYLENILNLNRNSSNKKRPCRSSFRGFGILNCIFDVVLHFYVLKIGISKVGLLYDLTNFPVYCSFRGPTCQKPSQKHLLRKHFVCSLCWSQNFSNFSVERSQFDAPRPKTLKPLLGWSRS